MRYSTLGVKRAILETRTLRDEFTCDLRFDDSRSPKVKINRCLFRFFFVLTRALHIVGSPDCLYIRRPLPEGHERKEVGKC